MTAWGPGDGQEVLSQGDGEPPRRSRKVLLLAGVAACVAAGYYVTSHQDDLSGPEPPEALPTPVPGTSSTPLPTAPWTARAASTPPTREELAGVWLADKGLDSFAPGGMWLRFQLDGTFAMDPGDALFTSTPWAEGHFSLRGDDLALFVEDGRGCGDGDVLWWRVGILPDDRLVTAHVADNDGRCQVPEDAWSARPLQDEDIRRLDFRP